MAESIVRIKCPGCGKFVRAPASLGGRRIKCPGCSEAITVPDRRNETRDGEILSDEMLPEVARDVKELEKVFGDTPARPFPASEESGPAPRDRSTPHLPRRPFGDKRLPPRPAAAAGSKRWVLPVAIGAIVLVVVALMAVNSDEKKVRPKADPVAAAVPEPTVELDKDLKRACIDYFRVFNRHDFSEIMKFHVYDPSQTMAVKGAISARLEKGGRYEDLAFKSVVPQGDACTVVIEYSGAEATRSEITMRWKRTPDGWKIEGAP